MKITPAQYKATDELVELVVVKIGKNRDIHPETAISAAARLSGSLLLRSFNPSLNAYQPGTPLLSNKDNEKGIMLVNIIDAYLSVSKVRLDQKKLGGAQASRGQAPQIDFLGTLSLLQGPALEIARINQLGLEQAAQAAALATALLIKECAPEIGAETGFNAAAYGIVEGSKTVPPKV